LYWQENEKKTDNEHKRNSGLIIVKDFFLVFVKQFCFFVFLSFWKS